MQWYCNTDSSLNSIFLTLSAHYLLFYTSASSSGQGETNALISGLIRLSVILKAADLLTVTNKKVALLSPYFTKSSLVTGLTFKNANKSIILSKVVKSGRAQSALSPDLNLDEDEGEADEATCPHRDTRQRAPARLQQSAPLSCFPPVKNEL